jgi:hypothetical protein
MITRQTVLLLRILHLEATKATPLPIELRSTAVRLGVQCSAWLGQRWLRLWFWLWSGHLLCWEREGNQRKSQLWIKSGFLELSDKLKAVCDSSIRSRPSQVTWARRHNTDLFQMLCIYYLIILRIKYDDSQHWKFIIYRRALGRTGGGKQSGGFFIMLTTSVTCMKMFTSSSNSFKLKSRPCSVSPNLESPSNRSAEHYGLLFSRRWRLTAL